MPPQPSGFNYRMLRGVLVLEFERCDTPEREESARIGRIVKELADGHPDVPILVNLHMLQLVSSELVEQLISLARSLKADGRKFALCSLRPEVSTLYEVLELAKILPRYDTLDQALDALAPQTS